jgi:hypothetical protein
MDTEVQRDYPQPRCWCGREIPKLNSLRDVLEDPANAELAKYCRTNAIVAACYNTDATIEQLALYLVRENDRLIEALQAAAACAVPRVLIPVVTFAAEKGKPDATTL